MSRHELLAMIVIGVAALNLGLAAMFLWRYIMLRIMLWRADKRHAARQESARRAVLGMVRQKVREEAAKGVVKT